MYHKNTTGLGYLALPLPHKCVWYSDYTCFSCGNFCGIYIPLKYHRNTTGSGYPALALPHTFVWYSGDNAEFHVVISVVSTCTTRIPQDWDTQQCHYHINCVWYSDEICFSCGNFCGIYMYHRSTTGIPQDIFVTQEYHRTGIPSSAITT